MFRYIENFAPVQDEAGVKGTLDLFHEVDILRGEGQGHKLFFFNADSMFAGKGPSGLERRNEDFLRCFFHPLMFFSVRRVVQQVRVQVSVAGMGKLRNGDVVFFGDPCDKLSISGSLCLGTVTSCTM